MAAKAQTKTKKTAAKAGKSTARAPRSAARKTAARARPAPAGKTVKPPPKRGAGKPSKPAVKAKASGKSAAKSTQRRANANGASAKKTTGHVALKPQTAAFSVGKLAQVALTATDLDASVRFYGDVLGFKLTAQFEQAGFAFFNLGGGVRLMVSATASEASLYFNVDDLDDAVRRLKRRGVAFLQKPAMIHRDETGDFGKKGVEEWMAFFHDPSGNLLALVERR